jgi:hypothetical protein
LQNAGRSARLKCSARYRKYFEPIEKRPVPTAKFQLNNSSSSQRADNFAARQTGVARLVRQICLLREQGDTVEAGRLEANDLAALVDQIRREQGGDALRDDELSALFAAETQRISDATLVADLLIPRLLETWNSFSAALPRPRPAAPASEPAPVRAPATVPAGPPAISDLLDAMLAAERMSTRMSPTPNR